MKVWLDGEVLPVEAARISPADRGFLLADGLFETMLVQAGEVQRLAAHLARLDRGAGVLGLPVPKIDFDGAFSTVLEANGLRDASLRLTLTRGSGPRGVLPPPDPAPTMLVTAAPLPPPAMPARCVIAKWTRRNEHSPLSAVKSLAYLDNIVARREADQRGADDALLLNGAGRLAEATAANLFVVIGGRIVTPPVGEGALPGIIRGEILALGAEERPIEIGELERAEEAFLTSSLGIRAIRGIEGHEFAGADVAAGLSARLFPGREVRWGPGSAG